MAVRCHAQLLSAHGSRLTRGPSPAPHLGAQRQAIGNRHRVHLDYLVGGRRPTVRTVQPLGVLFWGRSWTLGTWCELREDYRNFRLDRIASLTVDREPTDVNRGITLEAFLEAMQARAQ